MVGGGIIGLSLAIDLRKSGANVLILERGEPGREASYAAGGMLVDCGLETPPALQPLAVASAKMYPAFVAELELDTGMKVDLRSEGAIVFLPSEHVHERAGFDHDILLPSQLSELEPALAITKQTAFFVKERSVDPRALSAAALACAKRRGVDTSSGDEVTAVTVADGKAAGVTTKKTSFVAAKVALCAGAWSGQIAPNALPTRPVKGQMLCLISPRQGLLKHVIRTPEVYLIPRSDGRILVGTTVEEAGFDKRTDVETIQRLRRAAMEVIPELQNAKMLEDWAGLRPGTPDGLPILGEMSTRGYYVATGHFRDGILLAPITARVMTQVMEGKTPECDLRSFSAQRFAMENC